MIQGFAEGLRVPGRIHPDAECAKMEKPKPAAAGRDFDRIEKKKD
jgi:hypothetical protein